MAGVIKKSSARIINTPEIGRMRNIVKLPREIISDWRSDVSMIGPRMRASKKGAASKPTFRSKNPMMPNITMINISTTLLLRL